MGEYTLNKPAGEAEAKLEFTEGSEFWVYPDDPQFTRPFRYLRFKAVKDFDNGPIGCMSEITLYGKEANSKILIYETYRISVMRFVAGTRSLFVQQHG